MVVLAPVYNTHLDLSPLPFPKTLFSKKKLLNFSSFDEFKKKVSSKNLTALNY